MEKLNLGILYGGQSTEHEVSMRSAESVLIAVSMVVIAESAPA